jgi:hypothetical protein
MTIEALFIIIFGGVFGVGFIILGIVMLFDKTTRNKIPRPSILLKPKE